SQRGCSSFIHGLFIHAGSVVIADLLHEGGALRIIDCCFLQDVMEYLAIVFNQLTETAPARLVRRNRIVTAPSTTCILIEILTGIHALIHSAQIKRFWPGYRFRR